MTKRHAAPLEIAERRVREFGEEIAERAPRGWGYVLCLTEIGDGGGLAYASNCSQASAVDVSRELAKRIESGDESALSIKPDDGTVALALDEALETLALIGRTLTSGSVKVQFRDEDEDRRSKAHRLLESAIEHAEVLLLEHRPDLLADEEV